MGSTDREDKRDEILRATSQLLARLGFEKTTMRDVGQAVGLNKASLYYYFPNRDALVAEVIGREIITYITALQREVASRTDCRDRVTGYLVERFRIYQRVMNLHNLTIQGLRQVGESLRELYRDCRQQEIGFLASVLDSCVQAGELAACDTRRLAMTIVTIAEGFKLVAINNPDTPPQADIDYSVFEDDLVYTVSLMLDGLAP